VGAWFFDPLLVVQRHFDRADIRNTYLYNPYLGIGVEEPAPAKPAIAIANTTPVAPPSSTPAAPELGAAPPATTESSSPATSASAGSTSQAAKPAEQKPIRDFSEPDNNK